MRIATAILIGAALAGLAAGARGQDMQNMPGMQHGRPAQSAPANGAAQTDLSGTEGGMTMMAGSLGRYAMMRDASGTAWQPDSTPMEGLHWQSGGWTGMVHGYADLVYDHQGGPRGGAKTFSESMFMVMAQHAAGPGTLTLRTMLSLDPAMGKDGYPLLLQTGETADGVTPLVDRQHPHDLFMELAGVYSLPVGDTSSAFFYFGYPGEPALGAPTFMHRFSGMDDPAAPITHHWLDSTHITFGVLTAGFVHDDWKLEVSRFTGREPDQFRFNFDPARFDSTSARLSWNPDSHWALQASWGFLKSPEQLAPAQNETRYTASAIYVTPVGEDGSWSAMLAWGRKQLSSGLGLNGFLAETEFKPSDPWTFFARAESVESDEWFASGTVHTAQKVSLGAIHDWRVAEHVKFGIGGLYAFDFVPSAPTPSYGSDPHGAMVFLRLIAE